eukprot:782774-Prorocentrum_minimum.AAC.1
MSPRLHAKTASLEHSKRRLSQPHGAVLTCSPTLADHSPQVSQTCTQGDTQSITPSTPPLHPP